MAFVICAVLGEWLCVQRELQEIPISQGKSCPQRVQEQAKNLTPLTPTWRVLVQASFQTVLSSIWALLLSRWK